MVFTSCAFDGASRKLIPRRARTNWPLCHLVEAQVMLSNLRKGLGFPCASSLDEPPNIGMAFYAAEKAPTRGAFPKHDIQLLSIVQDVLVIGLRRKRRIQISYRREQRSAAVGPGKDMSFQWTESSNLLATSHDSFQVPKVEFDLER